MELVDRGAGTRRVDQQRRFGDLEREQRRVDGVRAQVLLHAIGQPPIEQVVRGQVDGESEVVPAIVDLAQGRDPAVQHQVGELLDQSGVFGDAHELCCRDHTTDRMRPAHQRLCADHDAGVQVELRLEMEMQLLVLDCCTQIAQHRQAGRGPAIDFMAVHLHSEPLRLRVEHRDVGEPQGRAVIEIVFDDSQSGTGGDDDLEPVDRDGTTHLANTVPREFEHCFPVMSAADDGELVACEPCQHVVGIEHGGEPFGHLDEQIVAGLVPQGVVHFLEAIEVEHDDERLIPATEVTLNSGHIDDRAFEGRAVRETGEPVEPSFSLDALVEHPLAQAHRELFGEVLEPNEVVGQESTACSGASSDDE